MAFPIDFNYEMPNINELTSTYNTTNFQSLMSGGGDGGGGFNFSALGMATSFLSAGFKLGDAIDEFFSGSTEDERYAMDQQLAQLGYERSTLRGNYEYQQQEISEQIGLLQQGMEDVRTEQRFAMEDVSRQGREYTAQANVSASVGGLGGTATTAGRARVAQAVGRELGTISRQTGYQIKALAAEVGSLQRQSEFAEKQFGEALSFLGGIEDQLQHKRLNRIDQWRNTWRGFQPWGGSGSRNQGESRAKIRFNL